MVLQERSFAKTLSYKRGTSVYPKKKRARERNKKKDIYHCRVK